jgi:hypothetical protein
MPVMHADNFTLYLLIIRRLVVTIVFEEYNPPSFSTAPAVLHREDLPIPCLLDSGLDGTHAVK